ncbi:MAG: hypothetical protein ACJAZP_002501 [Psychromonas sp.]|jgi:hypothetical protein|uniref:hypothetical protein n=1 Tax=Psychromonas sp. TaxID=1884585 RepID=UPI0039E346C6
MNKLPTLNALNYLLEKYFWLVATLMVLIDTFNGFFVKALKVSLPISIIAKLTLVLFAISYLSRIRCKKIIYIFIVSFLFIAPVFIRSIIAVNSHFLLEIDVALKYISYILFLLLFHELSIKTVDFEKRVNRLLVFSFCVICINVLLGYLGVGYPTYASTGDGFKGFFVAGNELSILFVVLSIYLMNDIITNKGNILFLIFWGFTVFVALSIGTKSSLIFLIFSGVYIATSEIYKKYGVVYFLSYFSLLIVFVVLAYSQFNFNHLLSISTIARAYEKFNSLNLYEFLFSGRLTWVRQFYNLASPDFSVLNLFIGIGYAEVGNLLEGKFLIESDLVDFFNIFGIGALLFSIAMNVFFILYPMFSKNNKYTRPIFIANFVVLLSACLAGHAWSSGMLLICLSALNGLVFINLRKNRMVSHIKKSSK